MNGHVSSCHPSTFIELWEQHGENQPMSRRNAARDSTSHAVCYYFRRARDRQMDFVSWSCWLLRACIGIQLSSPLTCTTEATQNMAQDRKEGGLGLVSVSLAALCLVRTCQGSENTQAWQRGLQACKYCCHPKWQREDSSVGTRLLWPTLPQAECYSWMACLGL